MARKSRVNIIEPVPTGQTVYNAAVYARLSIEDTDRDSLENQVLLIEGHIRGIPQLKIAGQYTDNGMTGRTFERDGFQRMMDDIRARKINCVAVKDLSRFARNYIEACEYLEKIFPFMGVRFISVNDNFDSGRDDPTDVIIMLKNLMNHEYARDISGKIRAAFYTKRLNGEYLTSYASYGYKKSPVHKNRLEIDGETAPVVQDIFRWRAAGAGYAAIAHRLNGMGIPCPAQRLRDKGERKGTARMTNSVWVSQTVKRILSNSVYTGNATQGKKRSVMRDGKVAAIKTPKSEWVVVENTHQPIIDMETWQAVQKRNEQCRNEYHGKLGLKATGETENVFMGLIICGSCGSKMYRVREVLPSGKVTYRYLCSFGHNNYSHLCQNKSMREYKVTDLVHGIISREIRRTVDIKAIIEGLESESRTAGAELSHQAGIKNRRLAQLRTLRMGLVESLAVKRVTEAEFVYAKSKYEAEELQLRQEIEAIGNRQQDESLTVRNKWITAFGRFMEEKAITREMAVTLIQKIIIHDNGNIDVCLNFRDDYGRLKEYIGEGEE